LSLQKVADIPTWIIAGGIFLFVSYIFLGGAQRVIKMSERIVPLKVGLFFFSALILLGFHFTALYGALKLIVGHALSIHALKGALIGRSIQEAIRFGVARAINATEAGTGVAGIFFGSTGSTNAAADGIMSMATVFISNYLVSFVVGLLIVASGVWDTGYTSTKLTVAAYQTVFGMFGAWMVALLTVTFGIGVLVAYGFVGRECWLYLTGGRFSRTYSVCYTFIALWGAIADVKIVWNSVDIANAGLLFINLYAILMLLPLIRKGLKAYNPQSS
jgi:AGCS family alanine or glycine:cation symporter